MLKYVGNKDKIRKLFLSEIISLEDRDLSSWKYYISIFNLYANANYFDYAIVILTIKISLQKKNDFLNMIYKIFYKTNSYSKYIRLFHIYFN